MKSNAEQEVDRLRQYLFRIRELAKDPERMRHDAAIAHLQAISKLVDAAR